jgi:hypothetical protein
MACLCVRRASPLARIVIDRKEPLGKPTLRELFGWLSTNSTLAAEFGQSVGKRIDAVVGGSVAQSWWKVDGEIAIAYEHRSSDGHRLVERESLRLVPEGALYDSVCLAHCPQYGVMRNGPEKPGAVADTKFGGCELATGEFSAGTIHVHVGIYSRSREGEQEVMETFLLADTSRPYQNRARAWEERNLSEFRDLVVVDTGRHDVDVSVDAVLLDAAGKMTARGKKRIREVSEGAYVAGNASNSPGIEVVALRAEQQPEGGARERYDRRKSRRDICVHRMDKRQTMPSGEAISVPGAPYVRLNVYDVDRTLPRETSIDLAVGACSGETEGMLANLGSA